MSRVVGGGGVEGVVSTTMAGMSSKYVNHDSFSRRTKYDYLAVASTPCATASFGTKNDGGVISSSAMTGLDPNLQDLLQACLSPF